MIAAADLNALLERLRVAGLRVGVAESVRASYLLGQLHQAAQVEWLREALRAVLVKSSAQAETFDEVFASWTTELLDRALPPDPVLLTPEVDDAPRPQKHVRCVTAVSLCVTTDISPHRQQEKPDGRLFCCGLQWLQ